MNEDGLRKRSDFRRVYQDGRSVASPDVVLVYLHTGSEVSRFAVVASRKVGNAIRRNRAKRLLREAHRQARAEKRITGTDFILIARVGAALRSCREIKGQLETLYRQAGLLTDAAPARTGD